MKRNLLLALSLVLSAVFFSCAEDGADGVAGPKGTAGSPQPVDVIVLGSESGESSLITRTLWLNAAGVLPPGSEITYLSVYDSIPPLSVLQQYDAAIVYTNSTPQQPVGVGDRLADYVDAGGKLVMWHGCFLTGFDLTGRLADANYNPFTSAASASDAATKAIDESTITFPLHPILVGIDVPGYLRIGMSVLSVPGVRPDATQLAQWDGPLPGVAINARGTIVAINDFPLNDTQGIYALTCNAVLFLTGRI